MSLMRLKHRCAAACEIGFLLDWDTVYIYLEHRHGLLLDWMTG